MVLDIDSTDDPAHGHEHRSRWPSTAFYDQHIDHPLLVFDGETRQLVTALLPPGRAHAARGAATILERLIRAIKQRCPHAAVVVRSLPSPTRFRLMLHGVAYR